MFESLLHLIFAAWLGGAPATPPAAPPPERPVALAAPAEAPAPAPPPAAPASPSGDTLTTGEEDGGGEIYPGVDPNG